MFYYLLSSFIDLEQDEIKFTSHSRKNNRYIFSRHFNKKYGAHFYIIKSKRGQSPSRWSTMDLEIMISLYNKTKYPIFEALKNQTYKQVYPPTSCSFE